MNFKIEGIVKVVFDTLTLGNGFQKREVVITVGTDKYPQDIKIEFLKDDVSVLDGVGIGDTAKIDFTLSGNEWKGKYFTNLVGKSITTTKAVKVTAATAETKVAESDDDLPF